MGSDDPALDVEKVTHGSDADIVISWQGKLVTVKGTEPALNQIFVIS